MRVQTAAAASVRETTHSVVVGVAVRADRVVAANKKEDMMAAAEIRNTAEKEEAVEEKEEEGEGREWRWTLLVVVMMIQDCRARHACRRPRSIRAQPRLARPRKCCACWAGF